MALTRITEGVIKPNENYVVNNINSIGVTTSTNFKTGTSNLHNVGIEIAGINVLGADTPIGTGATIYDAGGAVFTGVVTATSFSGSGNISADGNVSGVDATFTGNVSIGGTLTYEDVTNIDSVGLITARDGVFIPDNKKLELGNASGSGDLTIKHFAGGNSYITDTTNDVVIQTGVLRVVNAADNQNLATFSQGGASDLYFAGAQKITTASSGVNVVGTTTTGQLAVTGVSTFTGITTTSSTLFADEFSTSGIGTFADIHVKNPTDTRVTQIAPGFLILSRNSPGIYLKNNLSDTFDASIELVSNEIRFRGGGNNATSIRMETTSSGISFPQDIDVDGHTNLDNVSISGVTTTGGNVNIAHGTGQAHYQITQTNGNTVKMGLVSGSDFEISGSANNNIIFKRAGATRLTVTSDGATVDPNLTANSVLSSYGGIQTKLGFISGGAEGFVGTISDHSLFIKTNDANRIKIANNSAATAIGTNAAFNAMLTVRGDISGQLLHLKATEDTSRLMVSGTDANGCEVNLYDEAGGQKGILGVSSGEFFIKAPNSGAPMNFYTHNGSSIGLRLKINAAGDILLGTDQATIGCNTADGSDNRSFSLCGGSDASQNRGAIITIFGNEGNDGHSRYGSLYLRSGNTTTGNIQLWTQGAERLRIAADGKVGINAGNHAALTSLDIRHENGTAGGSGGLSTVVTICAGRNSSRGLEIKTGRPTSGNQNDAGVFYNAKDTESSNYHCQHVWQLGGNNAMVLGYTGHHRLGIGEQYPAYPLDLSFTDNTAWQDGSIGNGVEIHNKSTTAGTFAGLHLYATGNGANAAASHISCVHTANGTGDLSFANRHAAGGHAERMRLHSEGILKVPQGVDSQSNNGASFYTPQNTGYIGTRWTEQGAAFVFYMGELVSGSSSNASSHYVSCYASHHWGDYPRLIIWAHERYYRCSSTTWTFGCYGGSGPSGQLVQTESWGGTNGGHGTDNAGSISASHAGQVATYSGSAVHRWDLTMSNTGNYGYTRWYIGVLKPGARGLYSSAQSTSTVDSTTSSGGCTHFKTMSQAQFGPITYLG